MTTVYGGGSFRLVFRPRKTGPQSLNHLNHRLPSKKTAMYYNHRLLFNRITQTLQDKPCRSLPELARELQVSRRTIQNSVKKITGKKFRDLRDEVLLGKVKSLLRSAPNMLIKELCFKAGYRSPPAFARAVRRACRMPPRELRSRVAGKLLTQKSGIILERVPPLTNFMRSA
jgi:transcriptional regulator GlxA family with amidase domain